MDNVRVYTSHSTYQTSTNIHLVCTNRHIQMYINMDMHTSYRHGDSTIDTSGTHIKTHAYTQACMCTYMHISHKFKEAQIDTEIHILLAYAQ